MSLPPPSREAEGINLIKLCISNFSSKFWPNFSLFFLSAIQILADFLPRDHLFPRSMLGLAISHLAIYSQLHFAFNDICRLQTFRWIGQRIFFIGQRSLWALFHGVAIGKVTRNYNGNAHQCQISLACRTKWFFLVARFSRATMIEPSSICVLYDWPTVCFRKKPRLIFLLQICADSRHMHSMWIKRLCRLAFSVEVIHNNNNTLIVWQKWHQILQVLKYFFFFTDSKSKTLSTMLSHIKCNGIVVEVKMIGISVKKKSAAS